MKALRKKIIDSAEKRKKQVWHQRKKWNPVVQEESIPRAHNAVLPLLARIGKPEPTPFVPDPFQIEALERILREDVVVSAPTGSGKTWIAVQAAKEYLSRGCGIWYATPLKALSNAKYEEFGEIFGRDRVGILTGDRKENPDAPIVVGTTEILRNQLYDAMESGRDLAVDIVILDEAHYLGDIDRGVVWEEVLIYLPERVRVLLLSATISNAEDVSRWLMHVRKTTCSVVQATERPVPLHVMFLTPQNLLTPYFRGNRLFPKVQSYLKTEKGHRRIGASQFPDMNRIMSVLREFQLLPAIIFLKSRADCDKALESLNPCPLDPEEGGFREAVLSESKNFPELNAQRQFDQFLTRRAGSHHAGQLPGWRLLIERMMVAGHLEVIFSTSTVAAGVNFPARTVVLLQSDRFNGRTFVDMTSTDLHQMTGRAGRRGMDNAGFTLVVPGRYMDLPLVRELLLSEPEPLQSRIGVNFSMVLNLLLSHDPTGVQELLGCSFSAFHVNPKRAEKVKRFLQTNFRKHLSLLQELNYIDEQGAPTHDGRWAARLRLDHPLLIAQLIREREFSELNPKQLAALMAPFVMDKDKEIVISRELWQRTNPLWKRFRNMLQKLKPFAELLIARGFDVPNIMFWPAAAVFLWAEEVEWSELIENVDADEGDLAMLILRTADHLRQLLSLEKEEPKLAATAAKALNSLMRAPLV